MEFADPFGGGGFPQIPMIPSGSGGIGPVGNMRPAPKPPKRSPARTRSFCSGQALKENSVALALDAVSLGVDAVGPEGSIPS